MVLYVTIHEEDKDHEGIVTASWEGMRSMTHEKKGSFCMPLMIHRNEVVTCSI